jgi:GrpB-like predicted nucleotidyltransferase (UPF0157 family)
MIVIEPYDSRWPGEFAALAQKIRSALGNLALRVDHIGSTSVPGLGAKDVIDVQVTVRELVPTIIAALQDADFIYIQEHSKDHVPAGESSEHSLWSKQYFRNKDGRRACHVHVRVNGNPNQRYALLFRDYPRSNQNASKAIEVIKRELAKHHAQDEGAYYDTKDPVYDLVWEAAKLWAQHVSWQA